MRSPHSPQWLGTVVERGREHLEHALSTGLEELWLVLLSKQELEHGEDLTLPEGVF